MGLSLILATSPRGTPQVADHGLPAVADVDVLDGHGLGTAAVWIFGAALCLMVLMGLMRVIRVMRRKISSWPQPTRRIREPVSAASLRKRGVER